MDLHHKLRRPRGSSIHACNICGKEGHQAAQCPNGTVNWGDRFKGRWGDVTWALDKTPRHKDLFRHPWDKEKVDYGELQSAAKLYAETRQKAIDAGDLDPTKEAMELAVKKAEEMEAKKRKWVENDKAAKAAKLAKIEEDRRLKAREEEAKKAAEEAKKKAAAAAEAAKKAAEAGQWIQYKDQQGRPYYYNVRRRTTRAPPSCHKWADLCLGSASADNDERDEMGQAGELHRGAACACACSCGGQPCTGGLRPGRRWRRRGRVSVGCVGPRAGAEPAAAAVAAAAAAAATTAAAELRPRRRWWRRRRFWERGPCSDGARWWWARRRDDKACVDDRKGARGGRARRAVTSSKCALIFGVFVFGVTQIEAAPRPLSSLASSALPTLPSPRPLLASPLPLGCRPRRSCPSRATQFEWLRWQTTPAQGPCSPAGANSTLRCAETLSIE